MTANSTDELESPRPKLPAAIAAIALGLLGNALWELTVRPGFSWLADGIFRLAARVSDTVRDLPFDTAAIDASPLPGLIASLSVSLLPLFGALLFFTRTHYRPWLFRRLDRRLGPVAVRADAGDKAAARTLDRLLLVSRTLVYVMLLSASAFSLLLFSIYNQAVLATRVFAANVTILAARLPQDSILAYRAAFAQMRTRTDYEVLVKRLDAAAAATQVQLRGERLE